MTAPTVLATPDTAEYALWLGDDALILAQRLGELVSRAPEIEEDVALANIALDLLGHARSLLTYSAAASGRSEDDLAYWRDESGFRCVHLTEQPNGDFAHVIARMLLTAHYQYELYARLQASTDSTLAAIAAKAVKEVDYHRDHATEWLLRLALGTGESRRRMLTALDDVWPYVDEIYRDDPLVDRLDGIAVRPSALRAPVEAVLTPILTAAGLPTPQGVPAAGGGRHGRHSDHLAFLLAEMQVLARAHPGASW